MRSDPAYRKITADEFLAMDFGTDRRFELEDGVIVMMTGGSETHAWVQGNVLLSLRRGLRGSGCRSYGPDRSVTISATEVRYPDASIYCGIELDEEGEVTSTGDPVAVVEVLSPSTATLDQGTKLEEYKRVPTIRTIAFVDPVNRLTRTVERMAQGGWFDRIFSATGGISIPALGLDIPHDEIFARD